jgi:hypothetical protein
MFKVLKCIKPKPETVVNAIRFFTTAVILTANEQYKIHSKHQKSTKNTLEQNTSDNTQVQNQRPYKK